MGRRAPPSRGIGGTLPGRFRPGCRIAGRPSSGVTLVPDDREAPLSVADLDRSMPCSPDAWSAWPRPARSFWRAARCAGGVRTRWCPTHASAWCAPRTSSTTCRPPSRGCARTARSPGSPAPRRPATSSSTASRAYTGPAPCAAVGAVVFDSATAVAESARGKKVLLCRRDVIPDEGLQITAAVRTYFVSTIVSSSAMTSWSRLIARPPRCQRRRRVCATW